MTTDHRDRVICVSLSEAEWQAFVARHPQPVEWIRTQIRQALEDRGSSEEATPSPADTRAAAN